MEDLNTAVLEAAAETAPDARTITLSTGVIVHTRPVPELAFIALRKKYKAPSIPIWRNPEKGRDEPNPSDPDYIVALREYQADLGTASMHVMLLLGTELVSVPDGMPVHTSQEWREERDLLGISSGDSERALYLDWLIMRAAPTREDVRSLTLAIRRATGTTEEDVAEATKSARGLPLR